ncbi:hypothetical protein COLO4_30794 [Corchorus olitorius]|uniref:Uncharacterized protein n=1 Tax=Corchorus olitorius TaxID=93759 RepID=A0A1R3H738_9ROSI|nr:hypothetical protein COLO4_30794 [Corchorus olitorius]
MLNRTYVGKEMVRSSGKFRHLEILKFYRLEELENWEVEEGAMPSLKFLELTCCGLLKMMPQGLQHITTLLELKVGIMPEDFITRIQKPNGADLEKDSAHTIYHHRSLLAK